MEAGSWARLHDVRGPGCDRPHVAPPAGWKPTFPDYLYVSLTAATAFSPTDAVPYSKRAKFAMGSESSIRLVVLAMVVARAINTAKAEGASRARRGTYRRRNRM
jgi:hypothetical protein